MTPRDRDQVCVWQEGDPLVVRRTTCGQRFRLLGSQTPIEHGFAFCPYCGFRLKFVGNTPTPVDGVDRALPRFSQFRGQHTIGREVREG